MFAPRYFSPRYLAPRYWPPGGLEPPVRRRPPVIVRERPRQHDEAQDKRDLDDINIILKEIIRLHE